MATTESDDEKMVMMHSIRFWEQKAWRTEQKLAKETKARKQLEEQLEIYKSIPLDLLEPVLAESKRRELARVKEQVEKMFSRIGLFNMTRLSTESEKYKDTDGKIAFWKEVVSIYQKQLPYDEEEVVEEDDDE